MALETGTYINDLVITNPGSTDQKSQGDDHLRLIKTLVKQSLNGFTGAILLTGTDVGAANAYVITPTTALVAYTTGLFVLVRPVNANTAAATINISALGVKSIKTALGADPTSGDIAAAQPILLVYDGTNFVLIAGSAALQRTGNQTLTGNLTQTGNQTLTGNQSVGGTLGVTGATTLPTATTIGAVTAAQIGYVGGVTSAIQTQIDLKAALASPTFTGAPLAPTAAAGTNTTQLATTAFVAAAAFSAVLPAQAGNAGKYVTTNGTTASWGAIAAPTGSIIFLANNFGGFL